MRWIGNTPIGSDGRIESRSVSPEDLAHALDVVLIASKVKRRNWQFSDLVALLDQVTKVNPHQHITGSIGDPALLKRVIRVYRHDQSAREAFLDYIGSSRIARKGELAGFFDRTDADLLKWFRAKIPLPADPWNFDEADDRLSLTRLAFQSQHPDTLELLREAYRIVALENAAHGVEEVWFRTSFGDHESRSFLKATSAALEGAQLAEAEAGFPLRVRFLLGMRKTSPADSGDGVEASGSDLRAESLVMAVNGLRASEPNAQELMMGIDSVGMDSRWLPQWQAPARRTAADSQLRVAVHFGESWLEGQLLTRLEILEGLVKFGAVHQLDNANALFAVKDLTNAEQQYSNSQWGEIRQVQRVILETLAERGIGLGINPTSNDMLTRSLRRREGWRFRALDEPLGVGMFSVADLALGNLNGFEPLMLMVGNDNSRLYSSRVSGGLLTVSEELAGLWNTHGSTQPSIYGKVATEVIARLITNGFVMSSDAAARLSSSERNHPES